MKTKPSVSLLSLACLLRVLTLHAPAAASAPVPSLEVHEWGTITVLSGSDGLPLEWYQSPSAATDLPSFVEINPAAGGKGAFFPLKSLVRMETPVIYFYPQAPMRVSVSVAYHGGQVTEWFPGIKRTEKVWSLIPPTWEGDLVSPDDLAAQNEIPTVAARGEHYRHARDVPQAWLFRSTSRIQRVADDPAKGKDTDKFIFYRGKGSQAPPYQVKAGNDGTVTLSHAGPGGAIPSAFALTVKNGQAHWTRLPPLGAARSDDWDSMQAHVKAQPNPIGIPVAQAETELANLMTESLVNEGLTQDEARAMVATWEGHWFREPGTRVLAILPRPWVDGVLPLTITPRPTKLTRVFVARFETLTPQREDDLHALLREKENETAADADAAKDKADRLAKLELGRFAEGALERVLHMESNRMQDQFHTLQRLASSPKPQLGE